MKDDNIYSTLPETVRDYIRLVVKKIGWRRRVREEVRDELIAHFEDALAPYTDTAEREKKAKEVIDQFGDPKMIAVLTRRAKKRSRPLWLKAIIRTCQALGVILLYMILCSLPLWFGKPTIRQSYVQLLNNAVTPSADPNLNAMPYYLKAAKLHVKDTYGIMSLPYTWPGDFNDIQREHLKEWLAANKPSLDLVRQGAQKPLCWTIYDSNQHDPNSLVAKLIKDHKITSNLAFGPGGILDLQFEMVFENEMPNLNHLRQLAYLLQYSIYNEAFSGNTGTAINDCLTFCKFASHLQTKGLLIQQLVGVSFESLAVKTVTTVLEKSVLDTQQLARLQQELELTNQKPAALFDLSGERVHFDNIMQRCFTDDGAGNGRLLARGLPLAASDLKSFSGRYLTFDLPDRKTTQQRIDSFFCGCQQLLSVTPFERHVSTEPNMVPHSGIILLDIAGQADVKVAELGWRSYTMHNAAIVTLAAMRYKVDHGAFPADLNKLVKAGYLKELPMDPYSDKSLVYKKTSDDFILYSVGTNFKDDGGKVVYGEGGNPKLYSDEDDFVFWPVPKRKFAPSKPAYKTGRIMMPGMGPQN
jgi:hypothetical protein